MLEISNLTKKYGDFTAIENISFRVDKSSIFGLVGYNGAGKTTLLKTICGVLIADNGTITLDGTVIHDNADAKSRLFFVSDDLYILPQATMKKMAWFYRGYYPNWNDNVFNRLTEIFKLDVNKRMSSFSKGMQRQAFIIFALSATCDYLLLDEAFDGIDPMMRDLVRRLLLEAIAERGVSIIISSHNLRELEDLCDRLAIINGKSIVYEADIDDMRANKNRYKAAYATEIDESTFFADLGIKYKNFKREGKIVSFIADGAVDEIKAKLASKNPLLLETMPLTLEEIFLIEMEAQTYDFTDLFK